MGREHVAVHLHTCNAFAMHFVSSASHPGCTHIMQATLWSLANETVWSDVLCPTVFTLAEPELLQQFQKTAPAVFTECIRNGRCV